MARDYINLPAMLDAMEDELDLEAADVAKIARGTHERGLSEMGRTREVLKAKNAVLDRMKKFSDDMEARNTSNAPPGMRLDPTGGNGSSPNSPVEARPSENAQLHDVKPGGKS